MDQTNEALRRILGGDNTPPAPCNMLAPENATFAGPSLGAMPPSPPGKTSLTNILRVEERFEKRLQQLNDLLPMGNGRVVPETDDITIGEGRRLPQLAVLFLDICKFSSNDSGDPSTQDQMFMMLSLFMSEMLGVIKAHEGHFEKNTGDGLMAYFDGVDCVSRAVDAAITMHCYNDQVLSPKLSQNRLPAVKFRVGIETGTVTIARIGVRGDHNSLVAVGNTPNVACKLMTLIEDGGIVLGNVTRNALSAPLKGQTRSIGPLPGFVLRGSTIPYPAWELTYRAPDPRGVVPSNWYRSASGLGSSLGGGGYGDLSGGGKGGLGGLLGGDK